MMQSFSIFPPDNVAYDTFLRNVSGFDLQVQQFGNLFSYYECPRAQIFDRGAPNVTEFVSWKLYSLTEFRSSLEGMERLMRYNNFKHDPLSSQMPTCEFGFGSVNHPPHPAQLYRLEKLHSTICTLPGHFVPS